MGVTLAPGDNATVPVNLGLVGAIAPTVTTDAATNIGTTCVDLNATINANGFEVLAWFEWGPDTSYGSQTATRQVGNGTTDVALLEMLCGLTPATRYHYRAVASNGGDLVFGEGQIFVSANTGDTTNTDVPIGFPGEIPPTVMTDAATDLSASAAMLNANINPEGANTQVYFEWGLDTTYGNTSPLQAFGNGFDDVTVSEALTGLSPETEYHFRVVAFNAFGTTVGTGQPFTTDIIGPDGESEVACVEGSEPTPIKYGDHTVDCRIDTISDGDTFNFAGTAGDVIRITVSGVVDFMDPRLELRDPDGVLLHNGTCGGRCAMSVEPETFTEISSDLLTKTGTYSILMSDVGNDEGGAYTIQLERIPPEITPEKVLYDDPKQDTIDHLADHDFFVFEGAEATNIRITISAVADFMDPRLEIYDPDGTLLHNGTCGGRCSMSVEPSLFSEVPTATLTKTGTYHLLLSDVGNDEGGSYEINTQCLFGACPE